MDHSNQVFNLPTALAAKLQKNILLKNFTTLGIGGPAKYLFLVTTEEDLKAIFTEAQKNNLSFLIIGSGSNLLVSDQGVDLLVIKNQVQGINLVDDQVIAKSGTILQDLVDFSIAQGLSGLQKLTGIPGTVGGAIYGNAGAYGQTISDYLSEVTCLDPSSPLETITLKKDQCDFAYRDSGFKKNKFVILEAKFKLEKTDPAKLTQESQQILAERNIKYPSTVKCPGSFFKNVVVDNLNPKCLQFIPKEKIAYGKIPAGYLLEAVGAKGQKLGDIQISPSHANLFQNMGSGTAADFYQLASSYAQKVKEKFAIELEPEVQLINLPPIGPNGPE